MGSCFFIGHRETPDRVYPTLLETIERHITEYGVSEFVVGRYGNFDRLVIRALSQAKRAHPDITLMLMTPYYPVNRKVDLPEAFDALFYPPDLETVPKRLAIVRANRYMVERSDFLIAYVRHPASNARELLEYYPADVDDNALRFFGPERYHSDEFQDEAYLFIPFEEDYYRRSFWTHRPLTDFWRVGKGYAAKLEANGLYTMGDIARCSIGQPTDYHNEELLYKLFGVNAELLIDHAWGWEPCTIADIKAYKPENKSIVSGQILQYPYPFEKARLVIQEMADALALELVDKRLATNQLVLTVGYDIENLKGTAYTGEVTTDRYERKIPKHAHGTVNLDGYTSSGEELLKAATSLYDRIVDKTLLARRLTLCANHLLDESSVPEDLPEQIDLFMDYSAKEKQKKEADTAYARERKLQETMLGIKKRFGKNAILKGLNLEDGATAKERNNQIGGHKA